jgi:hypothetical protein
MPQRRVFHRKQRTEPMSAFIWKFLLAQSGVDFDRLLAEAKGDDGEMFYHLFYSDGWKEIYAAHCSEIEAEWRKRGWSREQRRFVMTPYLERGLTLAHDRRKEQELELWQEWRARAGWKTEGFPEYLERLGKDG